MKIVTKSAFKSWAYDITASLNAFLKEENNKMGAQPYVPVLGEWDAGMAVIYGNIVVATSDMGLTTITNTKTGKSASARLHTDDPFDPIIGLALAWARYSHREIPQVMETEWQLWEKLSSGDVFVDPEDKQVYMICGLNRVADVIANDGVNPTSCTGVTSYTCVRMNDDFSTDMSHTTTKTYGNLSDVERVNIDPSLYLKKVTY
jgi:hypothetical protein